MKIKVNNKRMALIRALSMLLILVFLLTYASVAWIKREWSPKIEQENISIATSGALVFQFTESGEEVTTTKSVNEILGVSDFALKPVSSASGKVGEFFALEYGDEVGLETFKHLNYASEQLTSEMAIGIRYGYIVLNFKLMLATLEGDNALRYIYLNQNSKIEPANKDKDVTSAIRISIFSEQANKPPILVGTLKAKEQDSVGVTNEVDLSSGLFAAAGERVFESYSSEGESVRNLQTDSGIELLKPQTIDTFSEHDCLDEHGNFVASEALFTIDPHKSLALTVCIWLEGEDPLCNDQITEDQINLLLQFSARTASGDA